MGGRSRLLLFAYFYLLVICIACARSHGTEHVDSDGSEHADNDDRYREFAAAKGERGLFPSIFNLATHAEIRATSTCGQQGPEYYCKLVEHVFLRQPQCDICDANNHLKNHPIDYAIDGTRKWWQSPSLSNGLSFERINITIDLRQEYQVAYVIIKAANSPRPGTWVLEKSLDGVDFTPWQYYATSDSECMRAFGVPAVVGVLKFGRDDEVVCTSYFSKLNPLENGEIHTSLVNGRPGSNHTSQELQDFTRARFVRLRLVGLRTLYADLMVINRRDGKLDQSVTRRYFYSISDISIGGQCICYGHAESCPPEEVHGQFRCECRHNTCGESCTECCPLFNQLPWKPGTHDHPNICQACQCFNHAASCVYDEEIERQKASVTPEGIFEGGGRCVDCQHNTGGINCEKCLPEFFRPANFSHYRPDACRPCDCDLAGAESNSCIRDETEVRDGLKPGDCLCKPGFGGRRCDRCAPGFRNHPVCDPCPCNQAGSLNFDTCEEDHCSCKQNVEGEFCDRCKPGTIYLDKDNALGCQLCFCFGKSTDCREQNWTTGYLTAGSGWNLTDLHAQVEVQPSVEAETTGNGLLIFNSDDYSREQSHSVHYWKAPDELFNDGHLLNSYGSNLHYYVYFVPREGGVLGHPTPVADLIIEGNGARLEYYSRLSFFPRENISVVIPLRPAENWYDARTRRPVGKMELMRVLADTDNIFVRAKYHQDQVQSSIYGLRIEQAVESGGNGMAGAGENFKVKHPVEVCACPEHFEGQSCESCEAGYRRVANQLYDGLCRKCECQEHSQLCDPHTGHCLECQHNTTGPRCEHCAAGHYGNPSLGGKLGACKPCACPTVENPRSSHCALSQLVFEGAAAVNQDEYVCTHCENGYEGNKCEVCADGYFGDPYSREKEEGCRRCECSGNIDSMAIGNCDRGSGECLRCIGHTTGVNCEKCEDNHWGSALTHTCQPCGCHHRGSQSLQCNNETGTCECNEGYTGKRCDRCEIGHGDVEDGCPECQCDSVGSLGFSCDEVSGQCPCKNGVYGKHCDRCVPSYYNFTEYGCQFCHCNEHGAIAGKECNNVTGECQCLPNVEGLKCEVCAEGFFNISSGAGCQACECDEVGSRGGSCHPVNGQCHCKRGVAGLKCDKCEPNHYGLNEEGCKQCRVCPAPGQVCDPVTGDCVCPPNTEGEVCERCTPNAWNYHPYRGCELCDCDGVGADSSECEPRTGHCKCKPGYVGQKCDQCEVGYFNFPDCQPCQCNVAGTDPAQCRGSACLCSNEGQCKCKRLTTGPKCDQCVQDSFSLEEHNPAGCTECFCFTRGSIDSETNTTCTQSTHVWRQIYASDRRVGFKEPFEYYTRRHNIHVLREQPLNYNSYPTNHTPLYWPLPPSFLGDRTSSYNGFIRFRIWNDDNYRGHPGVEPSASTFRLFPQLLLVGNHRIELEHLPTEVARDGKYKIRLHESSWRNRLATQIPLSRKQMMIALQNVQAIYVRATYNDMYRGDTVSISELSLDVASPPQDAESTTNGVDGSLAIGVEQCAACRQGYEGPSCQNPLMGRYCRKRHPDFLNHPDDIALVGWSAPCACNGHSSECDPESCHCLNCDHHTMGDFCEYCKHGYYGSAADGHPDACRKCACPLADNSFSDTCRISPELSKGYVCDACKPGYTGHYCESCIPGYYGNANEPGGYCAMCACHTFGSVHGVCDSVTGQCVCRDGVGGRDCSNCKARHAFIDGVCTSCDHGCHKELMQIEDGMERTLAGLQNLTDIKPVPRKRLNRLVEAVDSLNEILDSVKSSENYASTLLKDVVAGEDAVAENRYGKQAKLVEQEFNLMAERSNESVARIGRLEAELDSLRTQVHDRNRQAVDLLNQMARFIHRSTATEDPNQLHYLITQAEQLLNATRQQGQTVEKQLNYARKNAEDAERLLKEVLSRKLNDTSYSYWLDELQQKKGAIREYRDAIWDRAKADTDAAKSINQLASQKLEQLEKTISSVNAIDEEYKGSLQTAESEIADVRRKAAEIERNYAGIRDSQLATLTDQKDGLGELEKGIEESLSNPRVKDAERHAQTLETEARALKRHSLTDAYAMDTVSASNAYRDIAFALRNASSAAMAAKDNAAEAFSAVDPVSADSLVNLAQNALDKSNGLQKRLDAVLDKLSVNEQSAEFHKKLNHISELREEIASNKDWIRGVQEELDGHHDRINNVASLVDEAEKSVASVADTAQDFAQAVDKLNVRADSVAGFNQQAVVDAIKNVTQGTDHVNDMQRVLETVRERADAHEAEIQTVQKQLDVLKEKINEARERASKVKIGVKSEVGSTCVREYASPLSPSPSNSISLKYRPAMDSPDSLVFLTSTKGTRVQAREYIAVELRSKKIHVKWDVGGGQREAAIIKRNLLYIPNSDGFTWYHIDVKRVANSMRVSVVQKQVRGESERDVDEPTEVTVGEPDVGGDLIFNTVPGETTVSLGVQDAQVAEELGLTTNRFYGTIGEIKLDGNLVPLWVFAATHGSCDGHLAPRQRSSTGHMFRDGFAQVRMPMNERPNKLVTVVYSSYSPDGLLYFRGSPTTGDFLALQLNDGALEVLMKVGDHPLASVRSTNSVYADGKSHRVRVVRNNSELHLQIDPDDHVSTVTPANSTVLNVPEHDHFVGGVPPNFNKTAFAAHDVNFNGFFGCIQQIRPNQISDLDLDNPTRSQRVEPGCGFRGEKLSIGDRVVSFPTPGYLHSTGFQLTAHDTFSFTLATRSRSALLLHLFAEGGGSLTFYITDGRVACELATAGGKSEPLTTSKHYSDGLAHSVFLSRDGDAVQMRVDDREVVRGALGDEGAVGSDDGTLLLGGLPEKFSHLGGSLSNSDPLVGCLSDFQHNYERFALSLHAHQATIGSCEIPRYKDGGEGESGAVPQSFDRKKSRQSFDASNPMLSLRSLSDESYVGADGVGGRRLVPFASSLSRSAKRRDSCSAPDAERGNSSSPENGVRFGVSESSHARVNYPDRENAPSYTSFTLDFHLRTTQRNGLLWVWASYKHYNRYFILFLEKGFPTLEIQGHKEPKLLQYRIRRVNDDRWHRVQLRKDGRVMELQVDEFGVERFREAPNPKVMRKRMYVGGVLPKHRKKFSDVIRLPGFVGCMRDLKVDGEEQSLVASSKDLIPCASNNAANAGYIHDGGFATFMPLREHEIRPADEVPTIEFSLRFKPAHVATSANTSVEDIDGASKGEILIALLSANDHAYRATRFTVRIHNSVFVVSAHSPKHRVDYEWQFPPPPPTPLAASGASKRSRTSAGTAALVCPEQWHRFGLKLSTVSLKLRLDGGSWVEYPVAFPRAALHELRALPVCVGGLPASASTALGTKSLRGCVKDLEFGGRPVELSKAKKLHRAVASGCPH